MMHDFRIRRWKICIRVFNRPNWLWPYFSGKYTLASFGVAWWGVMIMRTRTKQEIEDFNAIERVIR